MTKLIDENNIELLLKNAEIIQDLDLTYYIICDVSIEHRTFKNCSFDCCLLDNVTFNNLKFYNCKFINSDIANINIEFKVEFIHTFFSHTHISYEEIKKAITHNCDFSSAICTDSEDYVIDLSEVEKMGVIL